MGETVPSRGSRVPREVGARQVASSVVNSLCSVGSLSFSATELAGKRYLERRRRLGHRGGRREIPGAHGYPPMMNKLYVGFAKTIELPPGGCLFIDDEMREIPRARVFDPLKDCFNPLADIGYKKAREIADVLYTISPQGENTLTVRNGKRALLRVLLNAKRLDQVRGDEEVRGMIDDLLVSPVLK